MRSVISWFITQHIVVILQKSMVLLHYFSVIKSLIFIAPVSCAPYYLGTIDFKCPVASAGGELTIDAFPPVQVLWMCCRAGAMGVILGVVDSTIVETKQRSLLS